MTLIIQSNRPSSRTLGNVDGIIGPRDFAIFSDFSSGKHILKNQGVALEKSFEELYSFSRASAAQFVNDNGEIASVAANVPRLNHNNLQAGARGLLIEGVRINSFQNPNAPASQIIPLINGATYCVIFSVEGPGSLTITGDITDTHGQLTPTSGLTLTATEGNPAYAFLGVAYGATAQVNVQVNGAPRFVQVERADRPWAPSTRISGASRSQDKLSFSDDVLGAILSPSGDFTLAMHVVDNYTSPFTFEDSIAESRPVFQALRADGDHLAYGARISTVGSKTTTLRVFMAGAEQSLVSSAGMPDSRRWTAVMARSGEIAFGACNGSLSPAAQTVQPNFKPSKVHLGHAESWITRSGLFGIVTKIAIYPRMLAQSEIAALSRSWN